VKPNARGNFKVFEKFAQKMSHLSGSSGSFIFAITLILAWLVSGPIFGFSDTWQLIINTGTTILTFLMVFIIQNTQNRDTEALQLKIDELIRIDKKANNALLDIEELSDEQLLKMREKYEKLAKAERASSKPNHTSSIESQ
jgi:low affinity Fe/Cu permease